VVSFRDVGWVWEGQGLDPGVDPSVLGAGDGCRFFGLRRANFMFHPNTDFALDHLAWLDEVTCDISKWRYRDTPSGGTEHWVDAGLEAVTREAALVSALSVEHPNVTGAFHDDMLGLVRREGLTAEQYAQVYAAAQSHNAELKLWAVVYMHELEAPEWPQFAPFMDVVTLWIWESQHLDQQDEAIARCRRLFPNKPVLMGCYLRDYTLQAPVPMARVQQQWESVARNLDAGALQGYSILSANLIDGHLEQARWVRDFIVAQS